ncbi:MAG: hypothetical protein MK137_07540, partial [Rickettsiales bacterium]|nr:hypothetical protein [Rickettsiales bacterium]
ETNYKNALDVIYGEKYNDYVLLYKISNLPLIMLDPSFEIIKRLVAVDVSNTDVANEVLKAVVEKGYNTKPGVMNYLMTIIGKDIARLKDQQDKS